MSFLISQKTGPDGNISMADSGSASKITLETAFVCFCTILSTNVIILKPIWCHNNHFMFYLSWYIDNFVYCTHTILLRSVRNAITWHAQVIVYSLRLGNWRNHLTIGHSANRSFIHSRKSRFSIVVEFIYRHFRPEIDLGT